jgi:penicillin amidase
LGLFKASKSSHQLAPKVQEIIQSFDGDMKVDSAGALIFNAWADQLTRNLFSRLSYLFTENYGSRSFRYPLLLALQNPNSPWCDYPKTKLVESCLESSNNALDKALDYLSAQYGSDPKNWSWGKAHIAVSEHRPLSKVPVLGKLFNITTPFPGDAYTVNVGRPEFLKSENPYETIQGPSMRAIFDLSDLEKSLFIYQTGQSGWVQSKLYRNMNPLWAKSEYLPLQMRPEGSKRQLELGNK